MYKNKENMMIKVFVGYDRREPVLFSVLSHSIHTHASKPVLISPLLITELKNIYWRKLDPLQSTEFSFSRFLVPYLCGYEGWAIFVDNDMVVKSDINKLWEMRDDRYAVMCVKHSHNPKEILKFRNSVQTKYEKKNWSSMMLFNCAKCKGLSLDYVNSASGLELHQFKWLASESLIGELPKVWNHLVDYDDYDENACLVHYTSGGPYFEEYRNCGYAEDWIKAREHMMSANVSLEAGNATNRVNSSSDVVSTKLQSIVDAVNLCTNMTGVSAESSSDNSLTFIEGDGLNITLSGSEQLSDLNPFETVTTINNKLEALQDSFQSVINSFEEKSDTLSGSDNHHP